MEMKKCAKCGIEKPLSEFEFRADTHKYRNCCKECKSKQQKEWRETHQDKIKQYRIDNKEHDKEIKKKYYNSKAEHLKEYSREYHSQHREEQNKKNKEWREQNKEYVSEYNKEYSKNHKEEILNKHREYIKNNKELVNKKRNIHVKKRKEIDPFFRYKEQVRRLVIKSFTRKGYKKSSKTYEIVGCDYETLLNHLKETYKRNYGVEWDGKDNVQIDHIIPLATAKNEQEVKELCNFKNLQFLKAKDNLSKRDKLDYEIGQK